MHPHHRCTWLVPFVLLVGCAPELATPAGGACPGPAPEGTALEITLEPAASLEQAPPIAQLVVRARDPAGSIVPLDPERLFFVEGEVGPAHLGQIARDAISAALEERIVPALLWARDDAVVLAPSRPLDAGQSYAVASGEPKLAAPVIAAEEDPTPRLSLVWPPEGLSAGPRIGVWCGPEPLPPTSQSIVLQPGAEEALLSSGAVGASGAACLHLESSVETAVGPAVPPPALAGADGSVVARIDPTPLQDGAEPPDGEARACTPDETPVGPGCARIADDRMWLYPPDRALLWSLSSAGLETVVPSEPAVPMLVSPLPPASSLLLAVATLDVAGGIEHASVPITTLPPMPHVVINEVLANPVGEEPEQEWVELYNDGLVPASLGGYVLSDVGGEAVLPDAELPPGAYALVVHTAYDEQSEHDVNPEAGTLLLRVESLGKNGLSNEGEPLKLTDAAGATVSRFPASPKPKAGRSVMRVHPKAVDEVESSFALCAVFPSPGSTNAEPPER